MYTTYIKKYQLKNKKINKKTRIILMSDIHISDIFNIKKLDIILKKLKKLNPDYICIPGDLIDGTNILKNPHNKSITLNFLKELGKISKVILSLGNHDVFKLIRQKNKKWEDEKNELFFDEIKKIKNVYLLDDATYTEKNITFTGVTLSYKYYKETDENEELFIKELNSKMLETNNNKYNILLCHSPVNILKKESLEKVQLLKNIDLILSGHMHNGMVHPLMEIIWRGNNGIITPNKKLYPKAKYTRGLIEKNKKVLIISGGISKLSFSSPRILHFFDKIYPMNIEIIDINNKDYS